jgi:hypothetical protein
MAGRDLLGLGHGQAAELPFESRSQLREGEPDGSRSCVSESIRRDNDPFGCDTERRCQDSVDPAVGLMRKDVITSLASGVVRRCGAMQK